ncbi:MAG: DUF3253 domain-containing protein [Pseudomonadota bacterium]
MSGAERGGAREEDRAANAILALLATRRAGASICPSEAARRLAPDDWRPLMPLIRRVAAGLAAERRIEVTQKGVVVAPETAKGAIRLRLPS